jgi:hypothetical protein
MLWFENATIVREYKYSIQHSTAIILIVDSQTSVIPRLKESNQGMNRRNIHQL